MGGDYEEVPMHMQRCTVGRFLIPNGLEPYRLPDGACLRLGAAMANLLSLSPRDGMSEMVISGSQHNNN